MTIVTNKTVAAITAVQEGILTVFGKGDLLHLEIEDRALDFSTECPEKFHQLRAKFAVAFSETHKTDFVIELTLSRVNEKGRWYLFQLEEIHHADIKEISLKISRFALHDKTFPDKRDRFRAALEI